jgi:hypothetical protein
VGGEDAGLLIESEAIAPYFGAVFDTDWNNAVPLIQVLQRHPAEGRVPVSKEQFRELLQTVWSNKTYPSPQRLTGRGFLI